MTDSELPRGDEIVGASVAVSGSEGGGLSAAARPIHARRWSDEEKARIVEESARPGAVQKEVAARHGVSAQSLRQWRRLAHSGVLSAASGTEAGAPYGACGPRLGLGRPWPDDLKARIVAESQRPGASISEVSRRHGVSEKTLRKWRRLAQEGALPEVTGDGVPAPFVPLVVEGASPDWTVAIEAHGVVIRLPVDSPVDRIVALALGLGRAS